MPSKALETYLSKYGGISDFHLVPLRLIRKKFGTKNVLYPGSWIHLTPSLVFPLIVYVDFFAKMQSMFNDNELNQYIKTHSDVKTNPIIRYHKMDYRDGIPESEESFDLLISLNGGFVSQYCSSYLKKNGILFVNNEHYDAIKAFTNEKFQPIGVFASNMKFIEKPESVKKYFLIKNNETINSEMVLENSKRPPSKAKYKLKKKALFYLFKKNNSLKLS